MGPLTSTSVVSPVVDAYFDRKLLRRALPRLTYMKYAQRRPLPAHNTKTIRFRRFEAFPLAQTPLVEGVPPTANLVDTTEVSSAIKQWGAWVKLSDLVQVVIENPMLNDTIRAQAEQAAQTADANARDEFVAGTSVFYGGTAAARTDLLDTTHKISAPVLDKVIRYFENGNAKEFTEVVEAMTKISTTPIWPAYMAIVHPDIVFTLRKSVSGFIPAAQYPAQGPVMPGEVGAYNSIRFISSTQAKVYRGGGGTAVGDVKKTTTLADVYATLVFAMDAVGVVPLDSMSLQTIIHPLNSAGASNPLNQFGTVGWKYSGTHLVLNDAFMSRIETTAGDLAP